MPEPTPRHESERIAIVAGAQVVVRTVSHDFSHHGFSASDVPVFNGLSSHPINRPFRVFENLIDVPFIGLVVKDASSENEPLLW